MNAEQIKNFFTRHQVLLERVKTGLVQESLSILPDLEDAIASSFNLSKVNSLSDLDKSQIFDLRMELLSAQKSIIDKAREAHVKALQELAGYESLGEASIVVNMVNGSLKTSENARKQRKKVYFPTTDEAWKSAVDKPVRATGQFLDPFLKGWGESHIAAVEGAVLKGWSDGLTIGQVMQQIRGTKARGYADGIMAMTRRHAEAVVRTSTQHVSQTARMATWEANNDIVYGFTYVATLDTRTTSQCRSLDGKVFPLGKGPIPPVHVNCRSTTIPKLSEEFDFLDEGATRASASGSVDAKQTYYEWLKNQPKEVQEEALGEKKAALFAEGKITAADFDAQNLGRTFAPMTLAQMKEAQKSVFNLSGKEGGSDPIPVPTPDPAPKPKKTVVKKERKPLKMVPPAPVPISVPTKSRAEQVKEKLSEAAKTLDQFELGGLSYKHRYTKKDLEDLDTAQSAIKQKIKESISLPEERRGKLKTTITKEMVREKLGISAMHRWMEAEEFLTSVVDKDILKGIPSVGMRVNTTGRAFYSSLHKIVSCDRFTPARVWAHEVTHHIEAYGKGISEKSKAFLLKRSKGEPTKTLNELVKTTAFDASEIAYEDEFVKRGGVHYMGKLYKGSKSTELLTCGIERLMIDPFNFAKQDPEYFDFMIDILQNPTK